MCLEVPDDLESLGEDVNVAIITANKQIVGAGA